MWKNSSKRASEANAMRYLPTPIIVRRFEEESFKPALPALALRWDPDATGVADRSWHLPDHLCINGPAPERFGCAIERIGEDAYHVKVLWNRLCLSWSSLTRRQILATALAHVLNIL